MINEYRETIAVLKLVALTLLVLIETTVLLDLWSIL